MVKSNGQGAITQAIKGESPKIDNQREVIFVISILISITDITKMHYNNNTITKLKVLVGSVRVPPSTE